MPRRPTTDHRRRWYSVNIAGSLIEEVDERADRNTRTRAGEIHHLIRLGLERAETRDRVRRALDALPPADRALLLSRADGQHTLDHLASLRGVPRSQIRDQIHHAQGELRKALGRVS